MAHTLLGISGALRAASTNTALIKAGAKLYGGADLTMADLRLPLYDGDLEEAEGIPAPVQILADQIAAADAILISTPEYNKNLSGVLKNALDWVSRTAGGPWTGKPVAILSAAAGRTGGERAQNSLRLCLQPFNPRILQGPEVMVAANYQAFNEAGDLADARGQQGLQALMDALKAEVGR